MVPCNSGTVTADAMIHRVTLSHLWDIGSPAYISLFQAGNCQSAVSWVTHLAYEHCVKIFTVFRSYKL